MRDANSLDSRNLPATIEVSRGGALCRRLSARDREQVEGRRERPHLCLEKTDPPVSAGSLTPLVSVSVLMRALAQDRCRLAVATCHDFLLRVATECAAVLRKELAQHTNCIPRHNLPMARRSDWDCSGAKARVKASLRSVGAARP
jgi:hypothetical protein